MNITIDELCNIDWTRSIHGWSMQSFKRTNGYMALKFKYKAQVKSNHTGKNRSIVFNNYNDLNMILVNITH